MDKSEEDQWKNKFDQHENCFSLNDAVSALVLKVLTGIAKVFSQPVSTSVHMLASCGRDFHNFFHTIPFLLHGLPLNILTSPYTLGVNAEVHNSLYSVSLNYFHLKSYYAKFQINPLRNSRYKLGLR